MLALRKAERVTFKIDGIVSALRSARAASPRTVGSEGLVLDLPSPQRVADAISNISTALFPRRFGGVRADSHGTVDYFVGHTLGKALETLQAEVVHELAFTKSLAAEGLIDAEHTA
ncbi:MAG TPA: serine acetyltransferase, partial [Hyphomicrobium sp.]|nr:serine acetyltransferase [Hyphomicrobium sp.]